MNRLTVIPGLDRLTACLRWTKAGSQVKNERKKNGAIELITHITSLFYMLSIIHSVALLHE